jgi:hypothetical protein
MLGGCAAMLPVDVAKPSQISVEEGMEQVAYGIVGMRQVLKEHNTRAGLLIDEVTVDFNISAGSSDSSKLKIDVANVAPAGLGGTLGLSAGREIDSVAERKNHITIKMKNLATAELNSSAGTFGAYCLKNPKDPACDIVLMPR